MMDLPDFNTARTGVDASQLTPPFEFDGVMMRVFPLRANLEQVQAFVDAYLNVAPGELAHFRTFLPYVYLMIINYGKMSVNAANLGWISQNEVAFSVPLLWYKRSGPQLVFHDFAYVSPFIYVDNDLSMTTGREVYGWPKSRVSMDTFATSWMTSPEASPVLARFSAMVFPELYAGMRQTPRTLLEIRHSVASSLTRVPFDPRAAWLPWVTLPKAIVGSVEMTREVIDILRGLGFLRQQPGAGPDAYASMLAQLSRSFNPMSPRIGFNTINLKQFRDAEHPNTAAYQAITSAWMSLRRFQRGGLLGDRHILQGDPSGGFSIDIHHYATAPIIESLGLEISAERSIGGATVHTLRPVFPMWLDVDMCYDVGRVIAWRAGGRAWRDSQGRLVEGEGAVSDAVPSSYNNARGAAGAEITGPFTFPSATLRVMPLLADEEKLAAFLRGYLGEPLAGEDVEVLPWGRYVYLVASSFEEMSSLTNDIGWWAERDLAFYVPAMVMRGGQLWKLALVPAYAYANSATAALTGAEVSGLPIAKSTLESPSNPWMNDEGPSSGTRRSLLAAKTMVLPVIELGQKAVERVVVEVLEGDPIPRDDEKRWRSVAQGWVQGLKEDLRDKRRRAREEPEAFARARALALQVLCQERPVHLLTLKQFRDSEHPTKACYHAVVQIDREIKHVQQIEEIETSLHVRIHRYPTQPIVETLGLVCMTEEMARGGVLVHVLEPVRPFWMKASLKEHLGRNLFVRAGTAAWSAPGIGEEEEESPAAAPSLTVGTWTVRAIEREHEPRRLSALVHDLVRNGGFHIDAPPISGLDIARVVRAFGPQAIIESILSEEWERWGECRWLSARDRIEGESAAAREGKTALDAAFAEYEALWSVMATTMASGPRMPSPEAAEFLLAMLLRSRLLEFVAAQRALKGGAVSSRRDELVERYRSAVSRLYGTGSEDPRSRGAIEQAIARVEEADEEACHSAIRSYSRAGRIAHHDLVMILAKAHQKPHHAIRRAAIVNPSERDRVFPVEHCWNGSWYVGPDDQRPDGRDPST
jgi:hypothetical protein